MMSWNKVVGALSRSCLNDCGDIDVYSTADNVMTKGRLRDMQARSTKYQLLSSDRYGWVEIHLQQRIDHVYLLLSMLETPNCASFILYL